jgi:hypothetical protein
MFVLLLPFLALPQDELLGIFERFEWTLSLDQVARLAAGYEIIHPPCTASCVRVNVVDGKDHPVGELVQAIQAAILALKMVTFENLHCLVTRYARSGPGEELLEIFDRHGSSSCSRSETRRFSLSVPFIATKESSLPLALRLFDHILLLIIPFG